MSVQHSNRSGLGPDWNLIGPCSLGSADRQGPHSIPILGRCMMMTMTRLWPLNYAQWAFALLHCMTIICHLAICFPNANWPMYPPPLEACTEELARPVLGADAEQLAQSLQCHDTCCRVRTRLDVEYRFEAQAEPRHVRSYLPVVCKDGHRRTLRDLRHWHDVDAIPIERG